MDRRATSASGGEKRTSPKSQKLYPLSSLVIQTFKEVADEQRDLVSRFVEREMSRIQDVDFCSRHIVGIGCRPGDAEGRIVFSPDHQHVRLYFAKPLLPTRIGGDVGPVIQEQRGLDVCLARAGKKRVLVVPGIRIVTIGVRSGSNVPLTRGCERREIGL